MQTHFHFHFTSVCDYKNINVRSKKLHQQKNERKENFIEFLLAPITKQKRKIRKDC